MEDSMYKSAVNVFKLVDVEGVVLGVGESITIHEPEGMGKANIRLERTPYHGCDFDFFDEESELLFDQVKYTGETHSGNSLIDAIYAVKGTDARIQFQYYRTTTPDLIYDSELILSSRVKTALGTQCRAKRVDFDENFKNRYNVKYDLNRTTDLNGVVITPPTYQDIVLTPQAITEQALFNSVQSNSDSGSDKNCQISLGELISSTIKNINTVDTVLGGETEIFIADGYGDVIFDIDIDVRVTLATTDTIRLNLETDLQLAVPFSFPGVPPITSIPIIDFVSSASIIGGVDTFINFTTTLSLTVNTAQKVKLYLSSNSLINAVNRRTTTVSITYNKRSKYLRSKYFDLIDCCNNLLQGLTGYSNSVISSFLDTQNAAILTGKLVRGFPSTEPFYFGFKETVNSLNAIFGLGFSITESTGTKLNLNKIGDFYQDKEIIVLIDGIKEFDISVEKDLIFNGLKIGYKNYVKGDTKFLSSGLNDFLTQHEYLSPIIKDGNKVDLISDFTTSGFVIDLGKQQSYTLYPNEVWEHDEDIFLVDYKENQSTIYGQLVEYYYDSVEEWWIIVINNYLEFLSPMFFEFITTDLGVFEVVNEVYDEEKNKSVFYLIGDYTAEIGTIPVYQFFENQTVSFSKSWTSPASSEAFDTFTGFVDEDATYNARYHPKYMMAANSLILNSGMYYKDATEKYKLLNYTNSSAGVTKFKTGEAYSTLDPDLETTTIGADITIAKVNQGNMLFIPELITFEIRITFTQIMYIREAMTGVNADDVNFGYITVINDGVTYKGFLKSMDYNPLIGMCTFVLIRKFE